MISKEKWEALKERLKMLGIKEEEIVEKFILGSGKGGQKVNKTSSCVFLKHIPTGIQVKCQEERSREANRLHALRRLCDQIEKQKTGAVAAIEKEIYKIRRQKKRRSRKSKEKMLATKKKKSDVKKLRQKVNGAGS